MVAAAPIVLALRREVQASELTVEVTEVVLPPEQVEQDKVLVTKAVDRVQFATVTVAGGTVSV